MSKKDYELIARTIRDNLNGPDTPVPVRDNLIAAFAHELAATNPRFSRERFSAACRGEDSHDMAERKVRYSAMRPGEAAR